MLLKRYLLTVGGLILVLLLAACSADGELGALLEPEALLKPPRLATATVRVATLTAEAELRVVPTTAVVTPKSADIPTIEPVVVEAEGDDVLTVWVNVTAETHREAMTTLAQQFAEQHQTRLDIIYVPTTRLVELMGAAQVAEQLPDVVIHSHEQTALLANDGLLDATAASQILDAIGREQFIAGYDDLLVKIDGQPAALPSDGWQYLLLYRSDWFAEAGLATPDTLDQIERAAKAFDTIHYDYEIQDEDEAEPTIVVPTAAAPARSGIVLPTEQDVPGTQRVFEWFATANDCQLIDAADEIVFDEPVCLASLDYFRRLVTLHGPPDFQTNVTAQKAFADGRTAMVALPPAALVWLVQNGEADLLPNVGVVTDLRGGGQTASFAGYSSLGIVSGVDEKAQEFGRFWFEEGYQHWLSAETVQKYPLYIGADDWQANWSEMLTVDGRSLDELYSMQAGESLSTVLGDGIIDSQRWLAGSDDDVVVAFAADDLTFAPILTRMVNGYIGSGQATADIDDALLEVQTRFAAEQ